MIRVVAKVADSSTPIGMIVGIAIAGVFLTFWSTLNYDVGWFLVGSQRVLEGADLYADGFVDMNPPLILYFFVPAAAIAGWTGFSEITLLRLQTLVVTAMCLWLAWAMITRLFGADDRLRGLYLLSALAFAGFVSPILNLGNEGVAFSQREHFVALFLLPYALLAAARPERDGYADLAHRLGLVKPLRQVRHKRSARWAGLGGACVRLACAHVWRQVEDVARRERHRQHARAARREVRRRELRAAARRVQRGEEVQRVLRGGRPQPPPLAPH